MFKEAIVHLVYKKEKEPLLELLRALEIRQTFKNFSMEFALIFRAVVRVFEHPGMT